MVKKQKDVSRILKNTVIGFVIFIGMQFLWHHFISFAVVHGNSMHPTFSAGDLVLVGLWDGTYKAGDVIVFEKHDRGIDKKFIKRLIAQNQSEVFIEDFKVFVDGSAFEESAENPPMWELDRFECRFSEIFRLSGEEIFVLGDNRCQSADSRFLETILRSDVTGKVIFRVLPSRWNWIFQLSRQ
jgi:signal peptidase I